MSLTSRRTVMGRKRYKPQEIVAKLRQVDVLVSQGQNMVDAIRQIGVSVVRYRTYAAELVGLAPDVILASASVAALQQASRNAPIVFANVIDPVGAGFVTSLAQPGGNVTGFTAFEYGISGKWLELLKEIAPHMTRAAVLRDPALAAG